MEHLLNKKGSFLDPKSWNVVESFFVGFNINCEMAEECYYDMIILRFHTYIIFA